MTKTEDYGQIKKSSAIKQRTVNIVVYSLLTIWGLFVLFPFYWMLLTSVKGYGEYNSEYIPKFYTLTPTLQNYVEAFQTCPCFVIW